MTQEDFYEHICNLSDKFQNRDLEDYLSALLLLVDEQKDETPDAEKLLNLLETAFTSKTIEFNDEWLTITNAPDMNIMNRKFTNPEIEAQFDKTTMSDKQHYDLTIEVLKFQIAELHKMREKQLKEEMRYFGVTSESGNRWYNFDPFTNLECGARCIIDIGDEENAELIVTWQTLGELLEMGRVYE